MKTFQQRQGDTEALLNEVKKAGYCPQNDTNFGRAEVSRAYFDKMTTEQQKEFCIAGGTIIDMGKQPSTPISLSAELPNRSADLALKLQGAAQAIRMPMSFFQANELAKQLLK